MTISKRVPSSLLVALLSLSAMLGFDALAYAQSDGKLAVANPLRLSPDHATVVVDDLDKEVAWYTKVLGFQEVARLQRAPGQPPFFKQPATVCKLEISGYGLDLVWQQGSTKHRPKADFLEQGWLNIVFRTPDLEAAYKALLAQAASVKADRNAKTEIVHLTLEDPEGNEIGIAAQ